MTSKHCPDRDICRHAGSGRPAGSCQDCAHGWQYERMAHKIADLHAERKRFKQEPRQARQALTNYPGAKEARP